MLDFWQWHLETQEGGGGGQNDDVITIPSQFVKLKNAMPYKIPLSAVNN